jgi:hypothetical protein
LCAYDVQFGVFSRSIFDYFVSSTNAMRIRLHVFVLSCKSLMEQWNAQVGVNTLSPEDSELLSVTPIATAGFRNIEFDLQLSDRYQNALSSSAELVQKGGLHMNIRQITSTNLDPENVLFSLGIEITENSAKNMGNVSVASIVESSDMSRVTFDNSTDVTVLTWENTLTNAGQYNVDFLLGSMPIQGVPEDIEVMESTLNATKFRMYGPQDRGEHTMGAGAL